MEGDNKKKGVKGVGKNGNLISANMRTPEERAAIGRKGGLKAQEMYAKRRTAKDVLQMLLDCKISKEQAREKLGDLVDFLPAEATLMDLINLVQIREAADGSTKAAEYIRDTSGDKPVEKQEISADIMTDADRALLAKVAQRTGVEPEGEQKSNN